MRKIGSLTRTDLKLTEHQLDIYTTRPLCALSGFRGSSCYLKQAIKTGVHARLLKKSNIFQKRSPLQV